MHPSAPESSDSTPPSTLFERLGGAEKLAGLVEELYSRVLADDELKGFFENVPMDRLRKMQFQFLASALDGPVEYSGAELTAVHAGRGITAAHFAKFCGHFADTLEAHQADPHDVDQVLGRLSMYRDKITGDANVGG
ncbi:MAG: group 1 truncated hemoglobin [Planctomycetota bacterium]